MASARRGETDLLVGFLLGNRVRLLQPAPAIGGDLRDFLRGLRVGEIRLGLPQLLVDFRRIDLGEQLAGLHGRADVDEPAFEIAVGARVDRRIRVRLNVARQGELGLRHLATRASWSPR